MNSECVSNLAWLKKPNTKLYSNVKTDERIDLLKEIRKDKPKERKTTSCYGRGAGGGEGDGGEVKEGG